MLEKIRKMIAATNGEGYANACEIWRGYGISGQKPYGYWLKPFGKNEHWLGSNWNRIQELWGDEYVYFTN